MKAQTFLAAVSLALGASMAIADSVSSVDVEGARENQAMTKDQRGVQACATFFVADILPNNQTNVRVIDTKPSRILDTPKAYTTRTMMGVTMHATDAADGKLLATGNCRVNRHFSVIEMETKKLDEARLASMAPNNLRFFASVR